MVGVRSMLGDQSGTAAAEMALVLPVALALLFVTFDGAYYMLCEQRVVKGVRNAARYAARLDLSHYTCPGGTFSGDAASIQNLARTGALTGGKETVTGWRNADVRISVLCRGGSSGIYEASGGNAPVVRVSTQIAYPSMMGAMGFTDTQVFIAAAAESPVVGL